MSGKFKFIAYGALASWFGALAGLSCGVFSGRNVQSGVDYAAHTCIEIATLACRPDIAAMCKKAHDINELLGPVIADIAAGKTACKLDGGKD